MSTLHAIAGVVHRANEGSGWEEEANYHTTKFGFATVTSSLYCRRFPHSLRLGCLLYTQVLPSVYCVMFPRYRQILDKAIQFTDADQLESLKAFVEASMRCPLSACQPVKPGSKPDVIPQYFSSSFTVVNENVSLVISRQLLTDFCTHLPNLPDATAKAVYHFTLEKIQPRVISFEEQVNAFTLFSHIT